MAALTTIATIAALTASTASLASSVAGARQKSAAPALSKADPPPKPDTDDVEKNMKLMTAKATLGGGAPTGRASTLLAPIGTSDPAATTQRKTLLGR